jgi:hypothetical protein
MVDRCSNRAAGSLPSRYQRSRLPKEKLCRTSWTRGGATPADKVSPGRGTSAWQVRLVVPGWIDWPAVNEKAAIREQREGQRQLPPTCCSVRP